MQGSGPNPDDIAWGFYPIEPDTARGESTEPSADEVTMSSIVVGDDAQADGLEITDVEATPGPGGETHESWRSSSVVIMSSSRMHSDRFIREVKGVTVLFELSFAVAPQPHFDDGSALKGAAVSVSCVCVSEFVGLPAHRGKVLFEQIFHVVAHLAGISEQLKSAWCAVQKSRVGVGWTKRHRELADESGCLFSHT